MAVRAVVDVVSLESVGSISAEIIKVVKAMFAVCPWNRQDQWTNAQLLARDRIEGGRIEASPQASSTGDILWHAPFDVQYLTSYSRIKVEDTCGLHRLAKSSMDWTGADPPSTLSVSIAIQ